MFARNSWYVGAWADEIGAGGMLARTLLGEKIVFYRLTDGSVTALEDRCCHRGLPLSMGCVQGDQLQCGYHGLIFDRDGICVRVPGQEKVPSSACVKSFAVVEQDHLVWIWMGDKGLADAQAIVRHPWHDDPAWVWVKDRYLIDANYQLITDNLMDLTHVGYVHASTIGGTPRAHSEAETTTSATEHGVKVVRWMPDSIPPPAYTAAHTFNTDRVDRWMEIEFFGPCAVRIHTGAVDVGTGAREGRRQGGFAFMGLNVETPETESTTHYFWSGAETYEERSGKTKDAVRTRLFNQLAITFGEDKVIVEAQQRSLDTRPDAQLVMIASDAGMMRARRKVSAMIDAEQDAASNVGSAAQPNTATA